MPVAVCTLGKVRTNPSDERVLAARQPKTRCKEVYEIARRRSGLKEEADPVYSSLGGRK